MMLLNKKSFLAVFVLIMLLALMLTPAATRATSFHTISIDGNIDFAADETISTTSGGYSAFLTWDSSNLYLGYSGEDVGLSQSDTKWMVWYIDTDPQDCDPTSGNGTNRAIGFNTQNWALPFNADYMIQIRTTSGSDWLQTWNGSSWDNAAFPGSIYDNDGTDFIELSLPLNVLGNPSNIRILGYFINEAGGGEWSYAAFPSGTFGLEGDTYKPAGVFYDWYEYDLTAAGVAPNDAVNQPSVIGCMVDDISTQWGFVDDNGAGGTGEFVLGPGTPPVGTGSARLAVASTAQGYMIATGDFAATRLQDISALSYSTYRTSGGTAQALALQFAYDPDVTDGTFAWFGRLTYEPYQQGTNPQTGVWENWDALNGGSGRWWASPNANSGIDEACPQSSPCTWSNILSNFPHIGINPGSAQVVFKAGSGWASFDGNVDDFSMTINGVTYSFDLEPYYPVHNITQATNYFTIQAGIDAANAGDVLEIEPGTYVERATINKSLTLRGAGAGTDPALHTILDGSSLGAGTSGIHILAGVTNVTIEDLTVQNYTLTNSNYAGISGAGNNNNFTVQRVFVLNNINGRGGVYLNGPVDTVLLDSVTAHDNLGRGIVIWNGHKTHITITNNDVRRNNCCGIELQDGTASGVTMTNNTVIDNTDSGMSAIGLMAGSGPNVIANNTITNNGRFGLEIKNPDGTGLTSGDGSIVVENNQVSITPSGSMDRRDHAGIAVFRRSFQSGNPNGYVDVPTGVVIRSNTVTDYRQERTDPLPVGQTLLTSEGFGIVIEGTNHSVTGNTITGNDIGIQIQGGLHPNANYVFEEAGDGDQENEKSPAYFGRGNAPVACGDTVNSNTFSGNGTDTRERVVTSSGGVVTNTATGKIFCKIQSAIDDAGTLNGHTIQVGAGIYPELIDVNKSITISGEVGTVIQPNENIPDFSSNHSGAIIWVQAHDVVIQDLEIDGDNPGISGGYAYGGADINAVRGIFMNGTMYNHTQIDNVTLRNLGRGVNLYGGQNHLITNNSASNLGGPAGDGNYGYGILLMGDSSATITDNSVSDAMTAGIFMQNNHSANATQISDNTVTNASIGLGWNMLYGGANGIFENNTVDGAELGMQVTSITNGYLEIRNNHFTLSSGSDEWGFYVWNTALDMVLITENDLTGGDIGVALFDDSADFGFAQAHLALTNNSFEGTGTAITVTSNSASHQVSLVATDNTISNVTNGFDFNGTEEINRIKLAGNSLDTLATVFDISTNSNLTAYANNITNFANAGLNSATGTFYAWHNWWGNYAIQSTGVDNESWTYRLGAPVSTWVDGTTLVSLVDGTAGANATFSGEMGTLVIVNHGAGLANVPFGKGIADDTGANQCADFYDFFAIGGDGDYDISIPVNSACTSTVIDAKLFQFALDGSYAPDLSCAPDTACWNNIPATRTGDILTASVDASDVLGTPFTAPSYNNNDPTAIDLASLNAGNENSSTLPIALVVLTLAWAGIIALRRKRA